MGGDRQEVPGKEAKQYLLDATLFRIFVEAEIYKKA